MVDLAVELVADPVADPGLRKEVARPVDEVIEVRDASSTFRARVGIGEGLPGAKAGRDVARQPRTILDAQQVADEIGEPAGVRLIVRLGL